MGKPTCPVCGGKTCRYGKTAAGSQRWICTSCKATSTHRIDNDAKLLREFLGWLLSRKRQCDLPGQGRSFRRRTAKFWTLWPMPPLIDEIHHVVYVDGIHLGRKAVVLIATSDAHVLGWYLARTENSRAWAALMSRIAAPDVVITDGGSGFEKARRRVWPGAAVQRCTFHAFCQVRRYTTSRPKLAAGVELYSLARDLLHAKDIHSASVWLERYSAWCTRWAKFLAETTLVDGRRQLTHERLVKARDSLTRLINRQVLFTYLDPVLAEDGCVPATNNRIEGGVNAPLRQMLRDHRGLSLIRRIKAVFWWCYLHTECPQSAAHLLKTMPADEDIDAFYRRLSGQQRLSETIPQWGDSVVWGELHHSGAYRMDWD